MAAAELAAREAALAPPRAHGVPPAQGMLRAEPEDFQVEEELGFAPSGAGEHLLLKVRKRNANTAWVARELARIAGCAAAQVRVCRPQGPPCSRRAVVLGAAPACGLRRAAG